MRVYAASTDGYLLLLEGGGSSTEPESDDLFAGQLTAARPLGWCREAFRIHRKMHIHTLCTRLVYALPLESVVVTAGSDAGLAVVDPFVGQVWWKQTNSQGASFSAIAWDARQSLLLAGDDSGTLSYFNIYSKERVAAEKICQHRILHISVDPSKRR